MRIVAGRVMFRVISKKLNETQRKHPTTDKELLAMDKGCQCFDNVTRGGEIKIHSDHKNLTFGDETLCNSQRALRAQTRINEVHGADMLHVSGDENVGGDRLSRLDTKANQFLEEQVFMISKLEITEEKSKELFLNLNLPTFDYVFPLDLGYVASHQSSDQECKKLIHLKTIKQGKGPALGETTIRGVKLKTHEKKF